MISYVIDAVAAALVVISFVSGMKRGLVKSVWNTVSWIVTAVLVLALINPAAEMIKSAPIYEKTYETVNATVSERLSEAVEGEKFEIPEFIMQNKETAEEKTAEELSVIITDAAVKIAAFVLLFIIIKILLAIVFRILDAAAKLPVINSTNKLLGGLVGLINVLFVIYTVCAVISLAGAQKAVSDTINSTYLVKYFYNNNILLQLVFKR